MQLEVTRRNLFGDAWRLRLIGRPMSRGKSKRIPLISYRPRIETERNLHGQFYSIRGRGGGPGRGPWSAATQPCAPASPPACASTSARSPPRWAMCPSAGAGCAGGTARPSSPWSTSWTCPGAPGCRRPPRSSSWRRGRGALRRRGQAALSRRRLARQRQDGDARRARGRRALRRGGRPRRPRPV